MAPNMLNLPVTTNWKIYGLINDWLKLKDDGTLVVALVYSPTPLLSLPIWNTLSFNRRKMNDLTHVKFIQDYSIDGIVIRGPNGALSCNQVLQLFPNMKDHQFLTNSPQFSISRCGWEKKLPYDLSKYKHSAPTPGTVTQI